MTASKDASLRKLTTEVHTKTVKKHICDRLRKSAFFPRSNITSKQMKHVPREIQNSCATLASVVWKVPDKTAAVATIEYGMTRSMRVKKSR